MCPSVKAVLHVFFKKILFSLCFLETSTYILMRWALWSWELSRPQYFYFITFAEQRFLIISDRSRHTKRIRYEIKYFWEESAWRIYFVSFLKLVIFECSNVSFLIRQKERKNRFPYCQNWGNHTSSHNWGSKTKSKTEPPCFKHWFLVSK